MGSNLIPLHPLENVVRDLETMISHLRMPHGEDLARPDRKVDSPKEAPHLCSACAVELLRVEVE